MFKFKYSKDRILGLDILRAYGILIVVYVHSYLFVLDYVPPKIFYFPIVIDVVTSFFVLSGFLIGGLIFKLIEKGRFNTPSDIFQFWKRRWYRTLPNYYFVLLLLSLDLILFYPSQPNNFLPKYYIFLQNFYSPIPAFFPESWSLAVEEWFYLLIPILFFIVFAFNIKRKKISFLIVISIFIIVPFFLRLNYAQHIRHFNEIEFKIREIVVLRLDSIMYGIVGAFLQFYYYNAWIRYRKTLLITAISSVLLVKILSVLLHFPLIWYSVFCSNFDAIATLMCLPFLSEYNPKVKKWWHTFFIHFSVISYSIYVMNHGPVRDHLVPIFLNYFKLSQFTGIGFEFMRFVVYLAFTLGLSYLLYMFFEKPMMDLRDKKGSLNFRHKMPVNLLSGFQRNYSGLRAIISGGSLKFWTSVNQRDETRRISIVLIVIVILVYFIVVLLFSPNIPFNDDYGSFFLMNYINADHSFLQKLAALFLQANEHRVFSYNVLTFLDYKLTGVLDFRHIIIIGNLGMVGLLYLLSRLFTDLKSSLLLFLTVVLLVCIPFLHIANWAIVSIGTLLQFFLIFASLYLLSKTGTKSFIGSAILAVVATFSFGTGMFTFIAGFIILAFNRKERKSYLYSWTLIMIFSILLYFVGYHKPASTGSLLSFLHHPFIGAKYFFSFFGAVSMSLFPFKLPVFIGIGVAEMIYLLVLMFFNWDYFRMKPLGLAFMTVILISAGSAAMMRSGFGIIQSAEPRYILMPVLFLAVLYAVTLDIYKQKITRYTGILLLASGIFYVIQMESNIRQMQIMKAGLEDGLMSFFRSSEVTTLNFIDQKIASALIKKSIEDKYYAPFSMSFIKPANSLSNTLIPIKETSNVIFTMDKITEKENVIIFYGWAFLMEPCIGSTKIHLSLTSGKHRFLFLAKSIKRADVTAFYKKEFNRNLDSCGFELTLFKGVLPVSNAPYSIGLFLKSDSGNMGYKIMEKPLHLK